MYNQLIDRLEALSSEIDSNSLSASAKKISADYRNKFGSGEKFIHSREEAVAYAIARMPATTQAVDTILGQIFTHTHCNPATFTDIGAGTGGATWAMIHHFNPKKINLIEYDPHMLAIGKHLLADYEKKYHITWHQENILKDLAIEKSDFVIASYILNEIESSQKTEFIKKIWHLTNDVILIIEPGTPKGYENIIMAREILLKEQAHLVGPCPHENICPLPNDDWCHFTARVQRSKYHKQLKQGELSYEDEKFSYLCMSRDLYPKENARILRHPQIRKKMITFDLCTAQGLEKRTLTKRHGQVYKDAKKLGAGDRFSMK